MCISPIVQAAGLDQRQKIGEYATNVSKQTTIGSKQDPAPGWGYAQQDALKINNQIQNQTPNTTQGGSGLKGDDTIQGKKDISGDAGGSSGGGGLNY
jgi:hypothetical protein